MNKKRELVEQVLDLMEASHVEQDSYPSLRAVTAFWIAHPSGHYNDGNASTEGALSCLMEENLSAILAMGVPQNGMKYTDLWREWGRQGCLKSVPTVMNITGIPILRIRHDSYLHWYRGYEFQNSYDAYANGSNGESDPYLEEAVELCRQFTHPDYEEQCKHMSDLEVKMCCTAIIASYPFYACRGKNSFYRVLKQYPEVFDEFLFRTGDLFHRFVRCFVPVKTLCEEMSDKPMDCQPLQEYAVLNDGKQIALLRLGETAVQLVWHCKDRLHSYTIKFPYWCNLFTNKRDQYLLKMWGWLAISLLTLAGFSATDYVINPIEAGQYEFASPTFYFEEQRISNLKELRALMEENLKKQTAF